MQLPVLPISVIDWEMAASETVAGTNGEATMKTIFMNDTRIRQVVYSPSFLSDHFCDKGHIIFCLKGDMSLELADGRFYHLKEGMACTISDPADAHRSSSENGCTLIIID